jgi:crotonobetainyl-CoA:carnitine CoA-transferase CaiB-like acyl-CoA transferase
MLRERFAGFSGAELSARFEAAGLPYAPITRPDALFDDPHLLATGGLAPVTLPADTSGQNREIETLTALLPLALDGQRLPLRSPPPALGSHTVELLTSLAYSQPEIESLREAGIIGLPSS